MSLSFPTSPVNGQVYQNWIWSSSVGAWQPNFAAGFVNSFNGRGGQVTFGAADNTAGNRVLLASQVVTTAAPVLSLTFSGGVFSSAFDEFEVDAYNLQASAANAMVLKFSSDNGATWNDGANNYQYTWVNSGTYSTGANGVGSTGATGIMFGASVATAASYIHRLWVRMAMLATTDRAKYCWYNMHYNDNSGLMQIRGAGMLGNGSNLLSPVNAIRFQWGSGNITRGVFNLYGISRASAGQ